VKRPGSIFIFVTIELAHYHRAKGSIFFFALASLLANIGTGHSRSSGSVWRTRCGQAHSAFVGS